uniref:YjfK family protein n=1 Tax=Thaumasiovibrio occultus TaxID=1891184 RepID=UPI000B35FBB3|nr:YjfK family protein [Thaumasiovibrio occultus]
MFDWFKKKKPETPLDPPPQVLGLKLGGAIELDALKMRLLEPDLTIEGAATTQLIKAVGLVQLDNNTRILRFYTDDDGFIQVLQDGGVDDADVAEVKLFYFYETLPVDGNTAWDEWLNHKVVQATSELDGQTFHKSWDNTAPVAMTEKTWTSETVTSETDQFIMLYAREANADHDEYLLVSAEEQILNNRAERCVALSTGFDLTPTDFKIIG